MVVHLDLSAIKLNPDSLQTKVIHELAPAHADQDDVRLPVGGASAGRSLCAHLAHAVPQLLNASDLGLQLEVHALLLQNSKELLGNLAINANATNGVEELHYGDVRPETSPHGAQLQADDAAADDSELLWDLVQSQSSSARDNLLLIEVYAWQAHDIRACGQHDVLCLDDLLAALAERNLDRIGACQGAVALDIVNLVVLEEHLNALGQRLD
mmetsp:Transcript_37497/g.84557  ORF Transcript_37497/g.84557 Transcript_37497/m.84557 type:complete len:212 (+) Transcript_37497:658-1293(+)